MTVLSMLQDPRGKGGTATAVGAYREWMDRHRAGERRELFLDECARGGLRRLIKWTGDGPSIPRVLPMLQVPPYMAARRRAREVALEGDEIHVVGASATHGWVVSGLGPTMVWLATTMADERRAPILSRRPWTRRLAYTTAQPILGRFESRVLHAADRILAMSSYTADLVVKLGVAASRVEVVMVPVDTTRFTPPGRSSRRRGAAFVGRAHDPRKGFDRVLRSLESSATLRERGVSVVSPGNSPGEIDGLRWLGPVEDLAAVYQSAEILLLPSRQEGLGIVALEALACGTPVAATACGGIDRILEASGGGMVAPSSDAFVQIVDDLLSDPEEARARGESGRRWVESNASLSLFLRNPDLFGL